MTDVRNDDFTLIHSIDDVIPFYRGNGQTDAEQRIGFETEICLYRKGTDGKPAAATSQECAKRLRLLQARGLDAQLEMASAVEYASPALPVTETAALNAEISKSWKAYQRAIADCGLIASDAALLPFVTLQSARDNIVDRDRARGLVKGMSLFKDPAFLKVTLLCTSTQVSLSFRDAEDLYGLLSTGYALSGVIFGVFGNYPAYIEGKDERIAINPRAAFYEDFGKDGGIPESFLQAKDGGDFIRRHARQVFNTEMLFYYDADKNIVWPEKPVKFEDLSAIGLNTRSNYDLAESFVYSDIKVCNIRDGEGRPTGKRIEVRGFDAGAAGAHAAVPFIHAVLRDPRSRDAVHGLLADYGLLTDQDGWQKRMTDARHAVAHHGGRYLDVPFGTRPDGTAGNLCAFCQSLGDILGQYAARNPDLANALAPVIRICETGLSQAEQKARQTKSYDHAAAQLFAQTAVAPARQKPVRRRRSLP
jgi:hypothetical protein